MPATELKPRRLIQGYLAAQRRPLLGGAALLLLSCLLSLLPPFIVGRTIDALSHHAPLRNLGLAALAILAVSAVSGVCIFGARWLIVGVSRDIEYNLRRDYFAHLLRQPMAYYQERRIGDLISLATNDLTAIRMVAGPAILKSLNTILLTIGNVAIMLTLSPRLTLVALCALPLTTLTARFFGQHIHARFAAVQEEFAALSSRIQETLSGIRVVRAYHQEATEMAAFERQNEELLQRNRSIIGLQASFQPLLSSLSALGGALVLWVGGLQVMRGAMTLGSLVQFNLYVARLASPMRDLGWVVNQFQRAAASLQRMEAELTVVPAIADGLASPPPPVGTVRLRDVSVQLPQRDVTLDHVSLEVESGETIGLVGPTGCGKTILLNTVARLLDVSAGSVEVDGMDVRDFPLAELRSRLGYVTQDSFLFSRTMAENVSFGEAAPGVMEAAWQAGLQADLEVLPHGLETVVGERGVTLSGGQKQRVSLARALLRDPEILLLDDAFSAVDSHTEESILEALKRARRGRTTIIVSHRLAALRHAHRLIVMEAGRLVATGTHERLLQTCPLYAELWARQRLQEELGAHAA